MGEQPGGIRAIAAALALTLLIGCTSARPIEGPIGLGQIAFVNGPRVLADRVVEESRCPADVRCVQAGRLVVRVTVFGGAWARQLDLELGRAVPVADGHLMLERASPPPRDGRPRRYSFTFRFEGGL